MKKFISQIHTIGNYNVRFSRADKNNDVMINRIEFLDRITNRLIIDFKMDFTTTKALYRYLNILKDGFSNCFILDIPSYNTTEVCQVEGKISMPNKIWLILRFQSTTGNIFEFKIPFSSEEFIFFLEQYFFYLLIDLVKTPLEK
jgi:hypothetical protein